MFDPRPERIRGKPLVWVDLTHIDPGKRTAPSRWVPGGWDFSVVAPGELLRKMLTAHGRWVALVRVELVSGDRSRRTAVLLLAPERAVTPRRDSNT